MEGRTISEGVVGAGEPMSVGELEAMDGVVAFWAGSDDWCCLLFLEEWFTSLRSLSSRALFLL